MAISPSASAPLYRNLWRAVILAMLVVSTQASWAQGGRKPKTEKGPRALALLELAPNGAAHLIPVAIMVNGEFYDASAYKASPVPMALESGTVYEAERSGVSLGLFTIKGALQGPNSTWSGAGTWMPTGSKPASTAQRAKPKPRDIEDTDAPPVLRRGGAEKPQPTAPATPAGSAPATPATATPAALKQPAPQPAAAQEDQDRPILRRGKPVEPPPLDSVLSGTHGVIASVGVNSTSKSTKDAAPDIQIIPAISDAGGPDPQPYIYSMKPDDELQFRKKILAMAADEIITRAKRLSAATITPPSSSSAPRRRAATAAKTPQPVFEEVQLHAFDLSSSNEPVLVLTAKAKMPPGSGPDLQYMITLVARQDIYGDFHKAFANVTDAQHLDVSPRYEFIDAVDADGDGRGELLFRKVSDSSSAFTIFRVIGNQLWPLFDGRLGG